MSRERALNASYLALTENRPITIEDIIEASDIPPEGIEKYRAWIVLLSEHYYNLMCSDGESFEDLIRSTYATKATYRQYTLKLGEVEQEFHAMLEPHLSHENEDVLEVITKIDRNSARFRKQEVQEVYS